MKLIHHISKGITVTVIATGFYSCNKLVDIPPPKTLLVTATTFNNDATATAALTSIYSQMAVINSESWSMANYTGLLSDELTNYSSNPVVIDYYLNNLQASNDAGPWSRAYNYIYQANAVKAGLEGSTAITGAVKDQLTGEALFIRALWHFYLTNLYGDIPVVTSPDYKINMALPRSQRAEVYSQIISDLRTAGSLVNVNYVDASDTAESDERARPNKSVVSALLARVYLYAGKYDSAELAATSPIGNTSAYNLCLDLDAVFLKNSTETIWQLPIPTPTDNYSTPDGQYFILVSNPSTVGNGAAISPQLLNSFEVNDKRRQNWIGYFDAAPDTFYFPYKYKVNYGTEVTEYVMMLRLAEQFLIRAEARAQQENYQGAIEDLNQIRERAGLPDYSGPEEKDSILAAILHERQVELFTEWGHRWLDLIRTGNANQVMSIVTPLKGGEWNPDNHQSLFPIPQTEIDRNPKLTQNNGY